MYHFFQTLKKATKDFFFLSNRRVQSAPFLRDCIDLKRIMMLVVIALIPCALAAWINTGLQAFVYSSANASLMQEYLHASKTFSALFKFIFNHFGPIAFNGATLFFIPLAIIYATGGLVEAFFATIEKKEISEGFLVTGILTALILPPTLPYWMLILGTAVGLILSKELFGGTGMNIFNPALSIRCILYFTFPTYMSGQVFVGQNPNEIQYSIQQMQIADVTASSSLASQNALPPGIKNIHIHAIGSLFNNKVSYESQIQESLKNFNPNLILYALTPQQMNSFVTSQKGLGLSKSDYGKAKEFARLYFGVDLLSNQNLLLGNMTGSMGETSKIAILLGAIFLILCRLASIRIMISVIIGAVALNLILQLTTLNAYDSAAFSLPIYKQFLIGSLLFGLVFMATEPVTAPKNKGGQYVFGFLIGCLTIVIRLLNPAYVEGVMLAILIANAFSSLIDHYATIRTRKRVIRQTAKLLKNKRS